MFKVLSKHLLVKQHNSPPWGGLLHLYIHSHVYCACGIFMSVCVRKYIYVYIYIHINRIKIFRDSTSELHSAPRTPDLCRTAICICRCMWILCLFSILPPAPCIKFVSIRGVLACSTGLAMRGFCYLWKALLHEPSLSQGLAESQAGWNFSSTPLQGGQRTD